MIKCPLWSSTSTVPDQARMHNIISKILLWRVNLDFCVVKNGSFITWPLVRAIDVYKLFSFEA
jgi:hypothetical protein